ncbi:MAG: ankyrin repeat domain-containing protein [Terracidiphilus sp.]
MDRNESGRYRRAVGAMAGKQAVMLVVLTLVSLAQDIPQKDKVPVTVKYDIIVYKTLPPREVSATITREDIKTLESKGYVKVGSVTASYSTTSMSDKEKVPASVEEMLLKEATVRGYDVVRIETMNAPVMIPSGSFSNGSCIRQKVVHNTDCYSTVNSAFGYNKTCKSAGDSVGPCTAWEQVPILVSGLATTGSVWLLDPKLAVDVAVEGAARKSYKSLAEPISHWQDAEVERLVAHGADVNVRDFDDETPLHCAVLYRRTRLIALFLDHGANINARNDRGETPLQVAASYGAAKDAELLLAHGADINSKDNKGMTPLDGAVFHQQKELVEVLLSHGADVNATTKVGWTPLMYAASTSQRDVVELLLAHGADVNARNSDGQTPLHIASSQKLKDIVGLLRQHGGHK